MTSTPRAPRARRTPSRRRRAQAFDVVFALALAAIGLAVPATQGFSVWIALGVLVVVAGVAWALTQRFYWIGLVICWLLASAGTGLVANLVPPLWATWICGLWLGFLIRVIVQGPVRRDPPASRTQPEADQGSAD